MWLSPFVYPARPSAQVATVQPPVGGLNYLDPIVNMPETDALRLVNWYPQTYGVEQRKGYRQWATGLGSSNVETLASTQTPTGVRKMYAWCGGDVYDVSSFGAVGAPVVTSLTSARWQCVNLVNGAGAHLVCFNGVDDGIVFTGSTVNRLVAGSGTDPYTWSGVNPNTLVQCTVHQKRLWAVQKDSTLGWYLPPGAIWGTAQSFDFGPQFKRGGFLAGLATWSTDDGSGSKDHLVAISSNGDLVVYAGVDVNSSSDWALVGTYYVGAPVKGYRNFTNIGGNLYFLTDAGLVSMNSLLSSTVVNVNQEISESRKVSRLLNDLQQSVGQLEGWELHYFSQTNQVYINVPNVTGANFQLVQNLVTKAWCTFEGYDALTWESYDGKLFFGGRLGVVYQAWFGGQDGVLLDGSGGTEIISQCVQAYSYMGAPAVQKQVTMYRPNFLVSRDIVYESTILYDFSLSGIGVSSALTAGGDSLWGSAIWGTSLWGGGLKTQRDWSMASGMGVACAIALSVTSNGDFTWVSTDYVYKVGGVLG